MYRITIPFVLFLLIETQPAFAYGNYFDSLKTGTQILLLDSVALFINKRRYQSYKDPQWVIDIVEFEYDKISARQH